MKYYSITETEKIEQSVKNYLSRIGSKGGKKSKRVLTPKQAKEMVRIREEKKRLSQLNKEGK